MVISTPRGINVRLVVIRQLVSSERQDPQGAGCRSA